MNSVLYCRNVCMASQKVIFDFRRTLWIGLLNTRNRSVCQNYNPFCCWMTKKLLNRLMLPVTWLIPVQLLEVKCLCHTDCLRNVLTRHHLLNVSTAVVYLNLNNGIRTNMKQPSCQVRASVIVSLLFHLK